MRRPAGRDKAALPKSVLYESRDIINYLKAQID